MIAEAAIDRLANPAESISAVHGAGLDIARLTVHESRRDPVAVLQRVRDAVATSPGGVARACAPLPRALDSASPTTGYDDVKLVALARLFLENVDTVQIDWTLVRPEAGAGRADLRRQRSRRRPARPVFRQPARPAAGAARRGEAQYPLGVVRPGRTQRPLRSDRGARDRRGRVAVSCMAPRIRLGAVDYLNARPLVHGLGARADRYALQFDPPSRCAALLHEGSIDLGMIPSIEFLRGDPYHLVPGVSIASLGEVASVALFTSKPIADVRTIALDSSSRTSAALLRILCARAFDIRPSFDTLPPDFKTMLRKADAALVIGDPALFATTEAAGLEKIDLGDAWRGLTGLPFVWAFWAGRPGVLAQDDIRTLQAARDAGVAAGQGRRRRAAAREDRGLGVGQHDRDRGRVEMGARARALRRCRSKSCLSAWR